MFTTALNVALELEQGYPRITVVVTDDTADPAVVAEIESSGVKVEIAR